MTDSIASCAVSKVDCIDWLSAALSSHTFAMVLVGIFALIIISWVISLFVHLKYPSKKSHFWFNTFFNVPISGFLTIFISLVALIAGVYIFSAEVRERRVDRASAAVLQIQTFLHTKYPIQDNIKKDPAKKEKANKIYYHGSTAELKESLEILYKNGRQFNFLYLPRTELGAIKLSGAMLWHADFTDALLEKANLSETTLYEVKFNNAILYKADLSKANLYKTEFNGANMTGTDLKGAVITATDFTDAKNLTKEQIEKTCWLRPGIYIYKLGENKVVTLKDTFPTLPDYLKDFDIHSIPYAKLGDKRGELAYCP